LGKGNEGKLSGTRGIEPPGQLSVRETQENEAKNLSVRSWEAICRSRGRSLDIGGTVKRRREHGPSPSRNLSKRMGGEKTGE